jgi:hypothetical protein
LRTRISWKAGLRVVLVVAAAALVWARFASLRQVRKPAKSPIPDLAMTNPLNRPGGGPAPQEAYDVYSALYRTGMNEALAFAEDSETDIPQVGQSCLKPTTPEEHEMADTFVASNRQSHRWEHKFSITQSYQLLPRTEISQALICLSARMRDTPQCASYKQLRYVRFLGLPGFNQAHTRALVSVIKRCAGFCGSGGIFEVEQSGGTWQRSASTDFTRDCSWMY